jgi:hypothetical protein
MHRESLGEGVGICGGIRRVQETPTSGWITLNSPTPVVMECALGHWRTPRSPSRAVPPPGPGHEANLLYAGLAMICLSPTHLHELVMNFLNDQRRGLLVQVVEHPLQLMSGPVPLANPHEEPLIPRVQVCPPRHGAPICVTVS